jgi:hypothetical protein
VTTDNNIIVGVIEPGDPYPPTDKSTRALLIFGMDGKQQHTYQYDSNKHRLFTVPWRITTNNNKDIVVVDKTSRDTGRVVVVGWEGGLRWTYTGQPHFKIKMSAVKLSYNFIEIKCQFLNYYKTPFNLKNKNGRRQKEKCQLSNINNKT